VQLAAEFGHADVTPELAKLVRQSGLRDDVLTVQKSAIESEDEDS
jgi:hypothetical protein